MTEVEWCLCRTPHELVSGIPDAAFLQRKLRLVLCAVSRTFQSDEDAIARAEAVELFADDGLPRPEILELRRPEFGGDAFLYAAALEDFSLSLASERLLNLWFAMNMEKGWTALCCSLVRDVVANPFRPASFNPSWRTSTAVAIAQGMYESRDFGPMPLLADALQDAGCEASEIIDHCRGPGPHVRGCWVVDGVLDKS
jgi:hypothetical protein